MTTCVMNPLMMGAIPRQTYQEHGARLMNDNYYDLIDEIKKEVQDNSSWSPIPFQALPPATTHRSSRSAQALLQQPSTLCFVPDSRLESDTRSNLAIPPSWSPYTDQADFKIPDTLSDSKPFSQQCDSPQSLDHHVKHHGFDMQAPTSNSYHAHYSDRSGLRPTQPVVGKKQSNELELLHQRQALHVTERTSTPDFPVGSPRTGSSVLKEFEKLQMFALAKKQMREQMKIRLERSPRSFEKYNQTSLPTSDGDGGSKLTFEITADNHLMLHCQQSQSQPQEQHRQERLLFSRGLLPNRVPTANQPHDEDLYTSNRGSPNFSFSMDTKINMEHTEALVLRRLQERVFQLGMGSRVGFRESLYRLARSVREQQDSTRTVSAEPDFRDRAIVMDMDLNSSDRPTFRPKSRVQIERQKNPADDRNLENMLFFPLRLPGLQSPTNHPKPRAVAAASSHDNWGWCTPAASEHIIRKGSGPTLQAQFANRDGSGAALKESTSRTVTPHVTWTGAPQLVDSASRLHQTRSSLLDTSFLNNRQANFNLTCGGPVAHTGRQLGDVDSSTTEPVDIRAPSRYDSQSLIIARDLGNGGQNFNFNDVGFRGNSRYSSQNFAGFDCWGQHIQLAAGNHGMYQDHKKKNFTMTRNDPKSRCCTQH